VGCGGDRLGGWITQKIELHQRLEIVRVEVGACTGEFLPGLQCCAAERRTAKHLLKEVLADQVGRAIALPEEFSRLLAEAERDVSGG